MTFAEKVLSFNFSLKPDWKLPKGFELLYPFDQEDTRIAMESFYHKFYKDSQPRVFLLGINPGRFGAGITGVPFTDPVRLEDICGIKNDFKKRQELSSVFVYEFIKAYGGPQKFYKNFYITSTCPLGFVTNGINVNYYDDKKLSKAVEPYIIHNLETQLEFGQKGSTAICLGRGKNFKYLEKLNAEKKYFNQIIPLPHPRWVMQYRRKRMEEFISEYLKAFQDCID